MTSYTIVRRQRQPGFRVDIVAEDGSRNSVLGFNTEDEAQAWIDSDRQLEAYRHMRLDDD